MYKLTQLPIMVACLAMAGCASTRVATPTGTQPSQPPSTEAAAITPTEASQPTATFSVTLMLSPFFTPAGPSHPQSPAPSITPIPPATVYPTPAVPLSPTGPWLFFIEWRSEWQRDRSMWPRVKGYLWAINQDGTGLTRITDEPISAFAIRPASLCLHALRQRRWHI